MRHKKIRRQIIDNCLQMNSTGLNQGTSGNISVRRKNTMLITPSGIPYDQLAPGHIASVVLDDIAEPNFSGPYNPSSEWHFHRAIFMAKPNVNAIIHTHSMFCTVLSIARITIPACHYMIAAFGGSTVNCADYATFGTPALSTNILHAMQDRSACLLANHGMVATGENLRKAMWAAVELETLAKQYYHASFLDGIQILSDQEIAIVAEKFKSYGPKAL